MRFSLFSTYGIPLGRDTEEHQFRKKNRDKGVKRAHWPGWRLRSPDRNKNLRWARQRLTRWIEKIEASDTKRWKINRTDFLTIAEMARKMGYFKLGSLMAKAATQNVTPGHRLMYIDLPDLKQLAEMVPFGKGELLPGLK